MSPGRRPRISDEDRVALRKRTLTSTGAGSSAVRTAWRTARGSWVLGLACMAVLETSTKVAWSDENGTHRLARPSWLPIRRSRSSVITMSVLDAICANCGFDSNCTTRGVIGVSGSKA